MLIVGRPMPTPDMIEPLAAAMNGAASVEVSAAEGRTFRFFPETPAGARRLDGSGVALRHFDHPDPNAAALISAGPEVLQAVGRARLHWRTEESPCHVEILNDLPLDLPMSTVTPWSAPHVGWDLAKDGVLLATVGDSQKAFGLTEQEARARATLVVSLIEGDIPYKGNNECRFLRFSFKRVGRSRPGWGIALPNGSRTEIEIAAWLTEHLGPLAFFKLDDPQPSVESFSFIAASEVGQMTEEIEVEAA